MNNDDSIFEHVEYKNCYVAFLDMLGFSKACKDKSFSCAEILKVLSFNSVINSSIIDVLEKDEVGRVLFSENITKSIYYSIMSDSIFIATPDNKNGLLYLLQLCTIIQNYLLENNVLLRGGIAKGEFYGFEDIAFGPALIEAYEIEGNIAVYPRIVLSKAVADDITALNDSHINLYINRSKEDSLFFINHLNPLEIRKMNNATNKLTIIQNFIEEGCSNNNPKIRVKYQWIKNYYETSLQSCSTFFTSEEEAKRIAEDFNRFIQERNKDTNV